MSCLYISYDGAFEPLGQSQVLSYLKAPGLAGLNFVLLTFDKKGRLDAQDRRRARKELKNTGIEWISLRYHKQPPVLSTLFDLARGLAVCAYLVPRKKIAVVHARGYVPAMAALFLKKAFGVRFIFDTRGFWADLKAECGHWQKGGLLHRIAKYFEAQFLKNADSLVVLSEKAKTVLSGQGIIQERISVIPCCVDTGVFKYDTAVREGWRQANGLASKFILAHIGSLESWYVLANMLDFFIVFKSIVPSAHFLILSRSPHDAALRLIKQKGLSSGDFTISAVDFRQVPGILPAIDAGMIFLSLGKSRSGCCPTKLAEFLSCGAPVVANSGIGDIDQVAVRNRVGVILNDFNGGAYKQAAAELLRLSQDQGLRLRCAETAKRELSLEIGVSKYRDVYASINNLSLREGRTVIARRPDSHCEERFVRRSNL